MAELGRGTLSCDPIAATQAVAPSHDWRPPPLFDDYRLIEPIGRGAAGQVWLALDTPLDRLVAIKFLTGAQRLGARERFRLEARAVARLAHPNVVTAFRVGEIDERPYLVSEYVSGQSLDKLAKPIPWSEALRLGLALARGMAAAHAAGVLHRDIKPANAILARTGEVKLLDFGLAKLLGPAQVDSPVARALDRTPEVEAMPEDSPVSLTASGAILGTPLYMAPEAWTGAATTRQMDVYSLGAMLYELCCGQPPHVAASFHELRHTVGTREPRSLAERVPGIDPRFADVIMRCLAREPRERWESGQELCAALEAAAAPPVVEPAPAAPRRRSRTLWRVGALIATLVAFALAGRLSWRRDPTPPAKAQMIAAPAPPAAAPVAPGVLDLDEPGDDFGAALATGDFNHDGYPDLAVGVPGESLPQLEGCGAVDLFAGGPGGLVPWRHITGTSPHGAFGSALVAGDLDGDGRIDLVIGAPGAIDNRGAVHVLHGLAPDGPVSVAGVGDRDAHFGASLALARVGDDRARRQLVVGAPASHDGAGRVYVFTEGAIDAAQVLAPDEGVIHFGSALAAGDLDADGDDDLVVAATDAASGRPVDGHVVAFRQDGGRLAAWAPLDQRSLDVGHDTAQDSFGAAVAIADFDADGVNDVAVGAPTGRPGGRYYRFHGRRGGAPTPWKRFKQVGLDELGDRYGATLLALDLDKIPGADLLVAAPHERPYSSSTPMSGEVYIVRQEVVPDGDDDLVATPLAPLAELDEMGAALAAADVDLDGQLDIFVGAPGCDTLGQRDAGAVFQFERQGPGFAGRRLVHEALRPE